MRSRFFAIVAFFSFLLVFPAVAFEISAQEGLQDQEQLLEDLVFMPEVLRRPLLQQISKEEYIAQLTRFLRTNGDDDQKLTLQGLERKKEVGLFQARQLQLMLFIRHDLNFDTKVTFEEIEKAVMEKQHQLHGRTYSMDRAEEQKKLELERVMRSVLPLDTNQNGVLSYQEMTMLEAGKERQAIEQATREYRQYLELDQDRDGQLTVGELKNQAHAAFAVFDRNNDDDISQEESNLYATTLRKYGLSNYTPQKSCSLKPVPSDLTILGINLRQGMAVSTVTAAGQDQMTTAVTVTVKDDQEDLYLVLGSSDPVIWRFIGNTDAIRHVAINSFHQNEHRKSSSGVTGITKNRVTFMEHGCVPLNVHGQRTSLAAHSVIKVLTGHFPKTVHTKDRVQDIILSQDDVMVATISQHTADRPNDVAPKGYDPGLWREFLRFYPGGLAKVDPSAVVADTAVKRYGVLPTLAGVAKFIHKEAIVQTGQREYLIAKNIARFPAGLSGQHFAKFIIAKGVKVPEGRPKNICILMKESGKIIQYSPLCELPTSPTP